MGPFPRTAAVLALLVSVGCTATVAPSAAPAQTATTATPPGSETPRPTGTSALLFSIAGDQARLVATLVEFVDAFNAGSLDTALALLTEDVVGSDCDYGRAALLMFRGKSEAAAWLRGRAAEHDRMEIGSILNENPDPIGGAHVVGVSWRSRVSDTLPRAIVPQVAAKVVFSTDGRQIRAFANGGTPCGPVP